MIKLLLKQIVIKSLFLKETTKYLDENFCNLPICRWNLHGINIWDSFEKSFDIYHQLYIY